MRIGTGARFFPGALVSYQCCGSAYDFPGVTVHFCAQNQEILFIGRNKQSGFSIDGRQGLEVR